jgi:hypothetical protein
VGRGKREEGRGKREEGRGKREEGRGKREEGRGKRYYFRMTHRACTISYIKTIAEQPQKIVDNLVSLLVQFNCK